MDRRTITPRLAYLDGVRGPAAVYVVLHHAALNVPAHPAASLAVRLVDKATGLGHYAVDVFIVLSGYCLMLPIVNGRRPLLIARFIKSRFVRIVPPYWVAMALSLMLIQSHALVCRGGMADLLSVSPCPEFLASRWRSAPVLATTLVSYGVWAALWLLDVGNPIPWGSSVYYVALFRFGMLAAQLAEWLVAANGSVASAVLARPLGLAVLVVGAAVLGLSAGVVHVPLQIRSSVVGVWAALFLVFCRASVGSSAAVRALSGRTAVCFGKRAYSLYRRRPSLQIGPRSYSRSDVPLQDVQRGDIRAIRKASALRRPCVPPVRVLQTLPDG